MIRLRRLIDRGRRHPVLGPLVVLLLVLLVALTVFHESHESVAGEIGALCIGIVVLLVSLLALPTDSAGRCVGTSVLPARAPPGCLGAIGHIGSGTPRSLPLRR